MSYIIHSTFFRDHTKPFDDIGLFVTTLQVKKQCSILIYDRIVVQIQKQLSRMAFTRYYAIPSLYYSISLCLSSLLLSLPFPPSLT